MKITVTIKCYSCYDEQNYSGADVRWLSYRVPSPIIGLCVRCGNREKLWVVRIVGENLNLTQLASMKETWPREWAGREGYVENSELIDAEPFWED